MSQESARYKDRARASVTYAVKKGRLARPRLCSGCHGDGGGRPIEAHHHDYSKPLEVEWLCRRCHRAKHRGGGSDGELMKSAVTIRATRAQRIRWTAAARSAGISLGEFLRRAVEVEVEVSWQVAALRRRINQERAKG